MGVKREGDPERASGREVGGMGKGERAGGAHTRRVPRLLFIVSSALAPVHGAGGVRLTFPCRSVSCPPAVCVCADLRAWRDGVSLPPAAPFSSFLTSPDSTGACIARYLRAFRWLAAAAGKAGRFWWAFARMHGWPWARGFWR